MEILPELVNLGNGLATYGDKLVADICREAIREIERLRKSGPGTVRGRLDWIAKQAEEKFGHSPYSSEPAEVAIIRELDRLQTIVDKLPKTAGGVQWYGQPVWCITSDLEIISNEMFGEFRYTYFSSHEAREWMACFNYGLMAPIEYCYSTRAAAEAAGGK